MAKQLKDILKQAHDVIKGSRPSTTEAGSLGKNPGVDYDPKAGDEQEFVAKHSVQKFDDPNGNGTDVFSASNVKYSLDRPEEKKHGNTEKKAEKAAFAPVKESVTKKAEDATCNMSEAGKWCPVHEQGDCNSMGKINEKKMKEDILPGTFVEPSNAAKDKASQIQQNDADKAVVSRAKMGITTEKTLTPAELKKREQVAMAIHRENPKMPMSKKMAIATATAKKVAEEAIDEVSTKTMGSYITKASAATTDKTLSDKKIRNRYAGVALADKKMEKKFNEDLAMPLIGGAQPPRGYSDEAAEMVKTELKALANKAMHLVTQMPDSMHVEPWCQSKIAVAKEMVSAVHDYMIYGDHDKQPETETTDTPITFPSMNVDNAGMNV